MKSSTRDSLRILIGADTFAPNVNGAARFAERLAVGMAGRGHDVHVLAPSPDGTEFAENFHGATVHRVRSRRTFVHPDFRISLPWEAKRRARQVCWPRSRRTSCTRRRTFSSGVDSWAPRRVPARR